MEVEWANDYSFTSDNYTMPWTIKYTPRFLGGRISTVLFLWAF